MSHLPTIAARSRATSVFRPNAHNNLHAYPRSHGHSSSNLSEQTDSAVEGTSKQVQELLDGIEIRHIAHEIDEDIYTWARLWKSFSVEDIEKLRNAFDHGKDKQLNIYEFVNVVRDLALSKKMHEARLQGVVRELTELFQRIDVNGDGQMSWDEFTAFIVDNADAVLGDAHPPRMLIQPPFVCDNIRIEAAERIFHFPDINKFMACRADGMVYICDGADFKILRTFRAHEGSILSAVHIPTSRSILTSSIDRSLVIWNDTSFVKEGFIPTPVWILCLSYSKLCETLYGGCTDGFIYKIDIENTRFTNKVRMHSDWVTNLLEIPELGLTLSCSLDQRILVWETASLVHRNELVGHRKGVLCLTYSAQFRLVFSSGFDRDILVWNPVVPGILHKMKGHEKSIIAIYALKNSNEIISVDSAGKVRLWDSRSYQPLQQLEYKSLVFNTVCFDFIQERLITADHIWYIWRFTDSVEEVATYPIISVKYNETFHTFVVASIHGQVTVWSAPTGELISNFEHYDKGEITSMQIHPLGRQILVGFQSGIIMLLNYTTGGVVKIFKANDAEVFNVFYVSRTDIAVCTLEAKIRIFSTDDLPENLPDHGLTESKREWKCMLEEISCYAYRQDSNQIIVCGRASFEVWKVTGLMVLHRDQPNEYEYTACMVAENMGLLVLANVNKELEVWSLSKHKLMYTFYVGPWPNIHLMVYSPMTNQFLTSGPDESMVVVWDLAAMISSDPESNGRSKMGSRTKRISARPRSRESQSLFVTGPIETGLVEERVPVCNARFQVGNDILTTMAMANHPPAVLVGSFDGKVRLLSLKGTLYGQLTQNKKAIWSYPIDMDEAIREQTLEAQNTLKICNTLTGQDFSKSVDFGDVHELDSRAKLQMLSPFYHDFKRSKDLSVVVRPFFMPNKKVSSAKEVIMTKAMQLLEMKEMKRTRQSASVSPDPSAIRSTFNSATPDFRSSSVSPFYARRAQSETPSGSMKAKSRHEKSTSSDLSLKKLPEIGRKKSV